MIKINQQIINVIHKNITFFGINKYSKIFFMHLSPNIIFIIKFQYNESIYEIFNFQIVKFR